MTSLASCKQRNCAQRWQGRLRRYPHRSVQQGLLVYWIRWHLPRKWSWASSPTILRWRLPFCQQESSTALTSFETKKTHHPIQTGELPWKQDVGLSKPKRHPTGRKRLLPLAIIHDASVGKTVDIILGVAESGAKSSFIPDDLHDFFDKKVCDIRATTASADRSSFLDRQAHKLSTFELISIDYITKAIRSASNSAHRILFQPGCWKS